MQTLRQATVELIMHLERQLLEFAANSPLDLTSGRWFNDEAQDHHERRYQKARAKGQERLKVQTDCLGT
jgi:hypothetical protein